MRYTPSRTDLGSSAAPSSTARRRRSWSVAPGTAPGGTAGDRLADRGCRRRDRCRGAEAGAPPAAAAPGERGFAPPRAMQLSHLRRYTAQDRRRDQRDPRLRAEPVTFARNCRAGFARRWWRRRRPTTQSPVVAPGQGCWRHRQLNLGRAKRVGDGCTLTRPRPHRAIALPPRLGRSAASSARRDGVGG